MCSTVSTSPGFAVFTGAVLSVGDAAGVGDGCCVALWAFALKQDRPRQTVKIQAMSFLMATNLMFFGRRCKFGRRKERSNSSQHLFAGVSYGARRRSCVVRRINSLCCSVA